MKKILCICFVTIGCFCLAACSSTAPASLQKPAQVRLTGKVRHFYVKAVKYAYSPEKIVVNQGDVVKITFTSQDVPHGFYIKAYGFELIAKKGEKKYGKFVATKKGKFPIKCSVFCGPGHFVMRGELIVR